tara:strand:- start:240 stop:842 length:603 start_codon:yes stop_codon:yes gene_type:complete
MEVKAYENPLPFIYIENLYTEEELKGIWAELDYYQANGNILGHGTRPAKDENDQEKTVKTGIFTDNVFYNREHSNILTLNRKIFENNIICDNPDSWYFRHFSPNQDFTLTSYYEDGGVYLPHTDNANVTVITWLYKEPKKFKGGDFHFPEHNIDIKCLHNHAVAFPGQAAHAVDMVKMDKEDCGKGLGRYAISQFLSFKD